MKFGSIEEFMRFLSTRPPAVEAAQKKGMDVAGRMLVQTAKDMIGEEIPRWQDLAESTVEEKQRLGFVGRISPTDPLYRTGELRASISHEIEGAKLVIGSSDQVALYQEEGTSRIPPRPFLAPTVMGYGHEAADIIANHELGAAIGLSGPLRPLQRRDGGGDQ